MFKDIKNYEGKYQINEEGLIKSLARYINNTKTSKRLTKETILKPKTKSNGYLEVNFKSKGQNKMFYVHRLVAETFIGEIPDGHNVNHKDGNKANNNLNNLEIVTFSENSLHYYRTKLAFITTT